MEKKEKVTFMSRFGWLLGKNGICVACVVILLVWMLASGCKKDVVEADPVPFLKIESVTPTTVTQFVDSVVVMLSYDDGDGDLGFSDPDSTALEVTDSRFSLPDYYFVQPLAPIGEPIHIRGTLRVELTAPFLLGNGTSETIQYRIRILDRAGNWSNEVTTPDITIVQ